MVLWCFAQIGPAHPDQAWAPLRAVERHSMQVRRAVLSASFHSNFSLPCSSRGGNDIPKAAWKRPIGQLLEHPGTKKPSLDSGHMDDGFWQAAPVSRRFGP